MYRNLTLKQIAIELNLLNDPYLKIYFQVRGDNPQITSIALAQYFQGPATDGPIINWINKRHNQFLVRLDIDKVIRRKLGIEPIPTSAPPLRLETTIPNLLILRECIGSPTKTATDFIEEAIDPSSDAHALAQAADAIFATPRRLLREYLPADAIVTAREIRERFMATRGHFDALPESPPETCLPIYKMSTLPGPITNVSIPSKKGPLKEVPQKEVPQAIDALIASVRNFHQIELGKLSAPLAEKACFLLSDSKSELSSVGMFGKSESKPIMPKGVALIVGEYITGVWRN